MSRQAAQQAKERARVSPEVSASARRHGRAILCNLIFSLKTSRLYSFLHPNVKAALGELERNIASLLSAVGTCRISRADDRLFLNEVQIKVDFGVQQSFQFVLEMLRDRGVGQIAIGPEVERSEIESLVKLLSLQPPPPEAPWESFEAAAAQFDMPSITFSPRSCAGGSALEEVDRRLLTMGVYFKTIAFMDAVLKEAREGKPMTLKRLKQAVQAIVDITWSEQHLLLSLVNVKGRGEPGSNHAVNVAVLSVALGARLGLSKRLLGDLGFAALLHDIGKVQLPAPLESSWQRDLPGEDLKVYASHVFAGVKKLLREKVTDSVSKCINVAFLHHYRHDRTGYPKLLSAKEQNLFTRIVAVADFYDNVTTPRSASGAKDPESVARDLMAGAGTEFDPLIVKAFVNLMGLYPLGCMVRLDTGEAATVVAPSRNPRFLDRPTVRTVTDAAGSAQETTIDLLDRDPDDRFRRSILKLYQPEELHLELEEYLTVI